MLIAVSVATGLSGLLREVELWLVIVKSRNKGFTPERSAGGNARGGYTLGVRFRTVKTLKPWRMGLEMPEKEKKRMVEHPKIFENGLKMAVTWKLESRAIVAKQRQWPEREWAATKLVEKLKQLAVIKRTAP